MDLRTPKGTTDYPPKHALLYEEIINKTISVFKTYGALPIDTPIFELKEILLNKYGEDTKLIYDLKGEDCALRYDLTVPFSRFMAMNKLKKIKRYQIGKVFRRDQPSIVKGRLREFIQADFDIAGDGLPMVIESELLSCVNTLLEMYKIGPFEINISDRRLLISILKMANVLKESIGTISSTIDKVDKLTKMELDKEFESKGLSQDQIETIHKYIKIKGREEVLEFLKKDPIYELEECKEAVSNMETLLRYSSIYGYKENLKINLSLARGLDYYTGLIMEATYKDSPVGSVLGGGRYDNLISGLIDSTSPSKDNKVEEGIKEEGRKEEGRKEEPKLSKQGYKLDEPKSSKQIPCAGFSIGISRIFSLLVSRPLKESQTQVYVSSSGGLFLEERMGILNILWKNKINAETFYTKRYNLKEHKEYCVKKGIKYLVVLGQVEVEKGNVSILNIKKDSKIEVSKEEMVEYILKDE